MKKNVIIIAFIIFSTCIANAQDTLWNRIKVDENISISLPGEVQKIDTSFVKKGQKFDMRILVAQTDYAALGITLSPNETNINVDNLESLKKALASIAKGATNSMREQGLRCNSIDTTIDKMPCKKLSCIGKKNGVPMTIVTYSFLINDKVYAIQSAFIPEFNAYGFAETDSLIKSIHVETASVKELQFLSKAESVGYKFGHFIGMLVFPAIVIGLIIYFVRR